MKTKFQVGDRVEIVKISQADAYFKYHTKLIGTTGVLIPKKNSSFPDVHHWKDRWMSCTILLDNPIEGVESSPFFFEVKIKKL